MRLITLLVCCVLSCSVAHGSDRAITPADTVGTYVNIRSGPSSNSLSVGQLRPGQTAVLIGSSGRWLNISLANGVSGFVHQNWVKALAHDVEISAQIVTSEKVEDYVNIRAAPTAESAIVGALNADSAALLVSAKKNWFEIETTDGVVGYVHRYWTERIYLTAAKTPKPRAAFAGAAVTAQDVSPAPTKPKRDRKPLARPAALLKEGRSADAYALLSRMEIDWAGDTGFDYLLGIAALDSGHPGEAIFALERVVKLLPKFTGARMELARALFDVGDHDLAEKEFVKLLENEPPEEVQNIIMAFLEIIRNPPVNTDPPQQAFYAMASGGYDSNANGAADINEFLGFSLDPRSREQDSPFAEAGLGAIMQRPLKPGLDLLLQADARHRHNRDADYVDNTYASSMASLAFARGDNAFNMGLAATWSAIDSHFNERGLALDLGWMRPLANDKALRITVRAGPVRYTDALKARDIDRLNYSLTVRRPVQQGAGDFDWSLIAGRDLARDRLTPYSNSRVGGRIGGRMLVAGKNLFWGLGALRVPYNGVDFFGADRTDKQFTANLAMEFVDKPLVGWTLVPTLSYVKNSSNVAIYDNDRVQIGMQFRAVK